MNAAARIDETLAAAEARRATHAPAVLASSFGAEDMVLIDLIARHALPIRIFTLDTGRLPEETHALIDRTRERYGLPIDIYTPDARALQALRARERRQRVLPQRRVAQGVLRRAQDRAARPRAGGQGRLDHRPAPRAVGDAQRRRRRGIRCRARPAEVQSARRLERRRRLELPPHARRALQRAARSRLSQHRLRALHARGRAGRGHPRRPLVVGAPRAQGMRPASPPRCASRPRTRTPSQNRCIHESGRARSQPRARAVAGQAARRVGAGRRRPPRLARIRGDPHPARGRRPVPAIPPCSSPAARIRWCCCGSRKRRFAPGRFPVPAAARRHRPQLSRGHRLSRPARRRARRAADRALGRGFDRLRPRRAEDAATRAATRTSR